jgi:GrpB-like predicted nucleotidyltransferase (UPF0157 family)
MKTLVRKVEVLPYYPDWKRQFIRKAANIQQALREQVVRIHHIGSTAIPGISAKPTLDLLPEVLAIEAVDACNPIMEELGYQARGEYGIPGRRYFVKLEGESHLVHVHIFQVGDPQIQRHLDFRDYLIAHPEAARQYSELKESLAQRYPVDIDNYVAGKDAFIQEIDCKAKEWRNADSADRPE